MKRLFCVLLIVLALFLLTACGSENTKDANRSANDSASNSSVQSTDSVDVDLTKLSSTMVYSEIYNMLSTPETYIGKTVRMSGQFAFYEDPETQNQYFACITTDATACCSQGLEFVLTGEHTYPGDYPELGNEITVAGTFGVYEENGTQYCQLTDATLAD